MNARTMIVPVGIWRSVEQGESVSLLSEELPRLFRPIRLVVCPNSSSFVLDWLAIGDHEPLKESGGLSCALFAPESVVLFDLGPMVVGEGCVSATLTNVGGSAARVQVFVVGVTVEFVR